MQPKTHIHRIRDAISVAAITTLLIVSGCKTGAQTGALAGGGIGAIVGQAIGGDTGGTLIGAAVGSGIGYVIGNEDDKKKSQQMSQAAQSSGYAHTQTGPLTGTRWHLVSIAPQDRIEPYASLIVEFQDHGHVVTTRTNPDGQVKVLNERYRVVGDTLIVNKPGYIINAQHMVDGDQLIVSAEDFRAVLKRIGG